MGKCQQPAPPALAVPGHLPLLKALRAPLPWRPRPLCILSSLGLRAHLAPQPWSSYGTELRLSFLHPEASIGIYP